MRSQRERLLDILAAIEAIEEYATLGTKPMSGTSSSRDGWSSNSGELGKPPHREDDSIDPSRASSHR